MQQGDRVLVQSLRADGVVYRWWYAWVEEISPERIVMRKPATECFYVPDGSFPSRFDSLIYYWPDKPYNLNELFHPDGERALLYVHIASPPHRTEDGLAYHDYELDVQLSPGKAAEVLDEDEFAAAALRYGYSPEFQERCRQAVEEAKHLAETWVWSR